ncbi:KAP family P-loop NTPase fold protein [Endozoicomonas sp. ALC066]|uniref:KAP family P-loop NTPase fold protein n=1 Tax=Endozoicomonas sp. ALC066 TaxID=3403078 RepID=UPI003BB80521
MRILRPELKINPDDPFAEDRLSREPFATELTTLFQKVSDPLVLNLYAEWGEGKTTFIKMWQAALRQKGFQSIYIDAFKHDFMDDPFITIGSSIYAEVNDKFPKQKELLEANETFKEKAVSFGKKTFAFTAGLATRIATQGAVSGEDLGEVGNQLVKQSGDAIENYFKSKFDDSLEQSAFSQLKDQLKDLGAAIKEEQGYPLLIIVDELDRCRPPFAIELLEKVKHLFSVENVNFILSTNLRQLRNSIKSVYGADIDADLYLQKFVTLSTPLPKKEVSSGQPESYYSAFCAQLVRDYEIEGSYNKWNPADLSQLVTYYAVHFNLSLRQIEKAIRLLALHFASGKFSYMQIAVFIAVLGAIDSDSTNKIARKELGLSDLKIQFDISVFFEEQVECEQKSISTLKYLSPLLMLGFGTNQEFNSVDEKWRNSFSNEFWDISERDVPAIIAERMLRYKL